MGERPHSSTAGRKRTVRNPPVGDIEKPFSYMPRSCLPASDDSRSSRCPAPPPAPRVQPRPHPRALRRVDAGSPGRVRRHARTERIGLCSGRLRRDEPGERLSLKTAGRGREPRAGVDMALVIAGVRPLRSLDRETGLTRKVARRASWQQVVDGLWRPVLRRGKYVGSLHKPDNRGLSGYLAQIDRGFRADQDEVRCELRSQLRNGESGYREAELRKGVRSRGKCG